MLSSEGIWSITKPRAVTSNIALEVKNEGQEEMHEEMIPFFLDDESDLALLALESPESLPPDFLFLLLL